MVIMRMMVMLMIVMMVLMKIIRESTRPHFQNQTFLLPFSSWSYCDDEAIIVIVNHGDGDGGDGDAYDGDDGVDENNSVCFQASCGIVKCFHSVRFTGLPTWVLCTLLWWWWWWSWWWYSCLGETKFGNVQKERHWPRKLLLSQICFWKLEHCLTHTFQKVPSVQNPSHIWVFKVFDWKKLLKKIYMFLCLDVCIQMCI